MNIWRERLSNWLSPLARSCPLSPNAISGIALILNLIASVCLLRGGSQPSLFLLAIALSTAGGLADAFDGIVARVQQRETRFGDFLDHVFDRISDTLLAACWLIGNDVREPIVVATVFIVMLNGYMGTQIEATFGRRSYEAIGRGEFVLALIVFPIVSYSLFTNGWDAVLFRGATIAEWMSFLLLIVAILGIIQRFVLARRLERS